MHSWIAGYTRSELDAAQERYGLTFPPDLVALLLERQPAQGYDWRGENPHIRQMLNWPYNTLAFDVENNGLWWPEWGERPGSPADRSSILRDSLAKAPKLIPLLTHRFIPEHPHRPGNPIFSIYGQDSICYGANLDQYFDNEFNGRHEVGPSRHIVFWSDLVARND